MFFPSVNKSDWLRTVAGALNAFSCAGYGEKVIIRIAEGFSSDEIKPLHVVTYACLIHELGARGYHVSQV